MQNNELGLEVKTSLIPNAGLGLYALKDFKKGDIIDYYRGKIITTSENQPNNRYILEVNSKYLVDGSDPQSSMIRYANCCRTKDRPKRNNCQLNASKPFPKAIATKNIKKGSEIYLNYGPSYWKEIDAEKRESEAAINAVKKISWMRKSFPPKRLLA
jgi:hypothetical protein